MRKIISFMHISLDGFVAGPKGEMDWITINKEIFTHVGKRIQKGDTSLYGRTTYNMMEGYWPTAGDQPNASKHDIEHSRWYSQVHKVVLSRTMDASGLANTTVINGNLEEGIKKMKEARNASMEDILIFGSPKATHALMKEGLIDGYWLFVNPVILGNGIPLFKDVQERIHLQLLGTTPFACGVTELNYVVHQP